MIALPGRRLTSTWLDDDAVVRVCDAEGNTLFAATEFVQERDEDGWLFRDTRTGATVRHCSPVGHWDGTPTENEPHRMRAEIRPMDINAYFSGVPELRDLFEVSVRTGRPVHWT
jgi:hypothetical protein